MLLFNNRLKCRFGMLHVEERRGWLVGLLFIFLTWKNNSRQGSISLGYGQAKRQMDLSIQPPPARYFYIFFIGKQKFTFYLSLLIVAPSLFSLYVHCGCTSERYLRRNVENWSDWKNFSISMKGDRFNGLIGWTG